MGKSHSSKSSSLTHEARTASYDFVEKHEYSNLPYARSLTDWIAEHGRKDIVGPGGRFSLREQRVRELIWPPETRLTDRQLRWVWEHEQPYCHLIAPYAFTQRKKPYKEYLWIQRLAEASATSKGASSTISAHAESIVPRTKVKSCVSSTKSKSRMSSSKSKLHNAKEARSPELIKSEHMKHKQYDLQQSCDTSPHQIKQEEDSLDTDVVELDQQEWTNDRFRKLERAYMMTEVVNREQALLIGQLVSQVNSIQQQNWLRLAQFDPSARAMHPQYHNPNGEADVSAVSPYALSNSVYQFGPHMSPAAAAVPREGQHTVHHDLPLQHSMHQPSANQTSIYQPPMQHRPISHVSSRKNPTLQPQVLPSSTPLLPSDGNSPEPSLAVTPLAIPQHLKEGTGKRKNSSRGESEHGDQPSNRFGNKKPKLKDNAESSQQLSNEEPKHKQSCESEREIVEIVDDETETETKTKTKTKKDKTAKKSKAVDNTDAKDTPSMSAPRSHVSALAPSASTNDSVSKLALAQESLTSAQRPLMEKCSEKRSSTERPTVEKTASRKNSSKKVVDELKCDPDHESGRSSARTLSQGQSSLSLRSPRVDNMPPSRRTRYPSEPAHRNSMYITLWGKQRSDETKMTTLLKWLGDTFSQLAVTRTGSANREFYVIRFPTLEALFAGNHMLNRTRGSFSCHGKPVEIRCGFYRGMKAYRSRMKKIRRSKFKRKHK